jgi:hypothetical protein
MSTYARTTARRNGQKDPHDTACCILQRLSLSRCYCVAVVAAAAPLNRRTLSSLVNERHTTVGKFGPPDQGFHKSLIAVIRGNSDRDRTPGGDLQSIDPIVPVGQSPGSISFLGGRQGSNSSFFFEFEFGHDRTSVTRSDSFRTYTVVPCSSAYGPATRQSSPIVLPVSHKGEVVGHS